MTKRHYTLAELQAILRRVAKQVSRRSDPYARGWRAAIQAVRNELKNEGSHNE